MEREGPLLRLFQLTDERDRAYRLVRKEGRLTKGSQGQTIQHPLLKYIDTCDKEIRALEDRFGVSPQSRLRMGVDLANVKRSIDDQNKDLETDLDDPR